MNDFKQLELLEIGTILLPAPMGLELDIEISMCRI
jgi:hypothetical protein